MSMQTPPVPSAASGARLVSLDALRGFDMIWIIGAEDLVHGLRQASTAPPVQFLADQLTHKPWQGFAFYDLIFPLFVFLAGVSAVLSLDKIVAAQGAGAAVVRVVRRTLLLYALGVVYYGGIADGWDHVRWVGVLQRIALSYGAAALIYLACRRRAGPIAAVILAILAGYCLVMSLVPAPGRESVSFAEGENIANYVDQHYLPGRKWDGNWDPEGLLSSVPAVATCLLGVLAGLVLKCDRCSPRQKVAWLVLAGVVLVPLGFLWGLQFPVIKKLWTSSYVLVAGGYSFLLLGLFYWAIDVCGCRRGLGPWLWVGTNALTLYLVAEVVKLPALAERFIGGPIKTALAPWGDLAVAVLALALILALGRFLYRRQIFLRV